MILVNENAYRHQLIVRVIPAATCHVDPQVELLVLLPEAPSRIYAILYVLSLNRTTP